MLPNIDFNIIQGISLVSRFDLDADLSLILANNDDLTIEEYKQAVRSYKETGDREDKRALKEQINSIKESFSVGLKELHPIRQKLKKQRELLIKEEAKLDLFEGEKKSKKEQKKITKTKKKIGKLEEELQQLEDATFYDLAFEWRFEFPEVLDKDGNFTGFDAVIGNPPYVRQELLKNIKPYLKENYEVYDSTADLYQYFIHRGMEVLKNNGYFHYIVANKWMRTKYGHELRTWIQEKVNINGIYDFGDLQVFEEATTYPCLLQLQKSEPSPNFGALEIEHLEFQELQKYIIENQFVVDQNKLLDSGWALINKRTQNLIGRFNEEGVSLKEYLNGEIHYGIKTGLNKAFVIDSQTKDELIANDPRSKELIKPFLGGRDIKRYQVPKPKKYVILIPDGWTDSQTEQQNKWEWFESEYPAIANHLKQFRERAKERYDQGKYWWELRACDYYDAFEKSKIMYQVFQVSPCFTYDTTKALCNNSVWIIPDAEKFLLAILNSKLGWLLISNYCTQIRNGYQLIFKYLGQIPIQEPTKGIKEKIESTVDQLLTDKKEDPAANTEDLEGEIDQLVYELYGLSDEEIAIVEESVGSS